MPSDPRDYKIDLATGARAAPHNPSVHSHRPFLSVHFACCNVYLRLYRAEGAAEYTGRCPRCAKSVRFPVAQGGTHARAFRVE
jgi:hypothetical protein